MNRDIHDVIIIGSGPAGLTAAIYASRANLKPLCIEGYEKGGQLMTTTEVENYPGFPEGIMGPELMERFRKQAERFGTQFVTKDVTGVKLKSSPFEVSVGQETYRAKSVIVSTGAKSKLLGIDAERKLMGRGVSTCATCDGAFFKNVPVAVVGGGDSAMEESNFLTRFASTVTIIHRSDTFRASKIMLDRARQNPKIKFITNSTVIDATGGDGLQKITLKNVQSGTTSELSVEGLFIAIGHTPNTQLFKGVLDMDEKGYLKTKNGPATNIPGVFACGDVQDSQWRQAITAAGSGCTAAIAAERYLESIAH
jgi:thioredoxin reductase (NADPH)